MNTIKKMITEGYLTAKDFGGELNEAQLLRCKVSVLRELMLEQRRVNLERKKDYLARDNYSVVLNAIVNDLGFAELTCVCISVPSPQRAGTETQKRMYAEMKAREIVQQLNK